MTESNGRGRTPNAYFIIGEWCKFNNIHGKARVDLLNRCKQLYREAWESGHQSQLYGSIKGAYHNGFIGRMV